MRQLLATLTEFFHWWKIKVIPVRIAAVYVLLLCAIFFLLGNYRTPSDYRQMENQLNEARQQMRRFAGELAQRNSELNHQRAREQLDKKTIELLGAKMDWLENQSIRWQEETAFYRHVLENQTTDNDIVIHALGASPDFTRQGWKLNAILARPGKRKEFSGSYFFEVLEAGSGGSYSLIRLPPEGQTAFTMSIYHEIEELINLPADKTIENLRIVILDDKNNHIASAEMGDTGGDETDQPLVRNPQL